MAFHVQYFSSLSICTSFISRPAVHPAATSISKLRSGVASSLVQRVADIPRVSNGENVARRSANYQPPLWTFDYVQSLGSKYTRESYAERIENLKEEVREILKKLEGDNIAQLEHIDVLQRLGISYHFKVEIKSMLDKIYNNKSKNNNLYATALEFRILRQHGYRLPQQVFNSFRDEFGNFSDDATMAMLSLYEASFLMIEGETILEEARDFSTKCLEEYMQMIKERKKDQNDILSLLVSHALELPLHWRTPRLESRWFIDLYGKRHDMNPLLLKLGKLDFNIVQSTYQEELKDVFRWWIKTGLSSDKGFSLQEIGWWRISYGQWDLRLSLNLVAIEDWELK